MYKVIKTCSEADGVRDKVTMVLRVCTSVDSSLVLNRNDGFWGKLLLT